MAHSFIILNITLEVFYKMFLGKGIKINHRGRKFDLERNDTCLSNVCSLQTLALCWSNPQPPHHLA